MNRFWVGAVLAAGLLVSVADARLRVCTWNVTNYNGDRVADFQTALYGEFQGRSMQLDVLIGQEFISQTAVNTFRNLLNTAPGSPGDWQAAPFVNGNDTDSAFFYRTSRVTFITQTVVAIGGNPPAIPRNVMRYDIRPVGYAGANATIAMYSSHMKSGSATSDLDRRLAEAEFIRTNAQGLPADWHFLIGADFNIPTSTQAAYQKLVGSEINNAGRFFDPINRPGNWNNTAATRNINTQDPATQMDDRFDQILISADLFDSKGIDYIGNPSIPFKNYSSADPQPWNDPNHSYRCWGNDGSAYNAPLTTTNNSMVGATIAQALINTADGLGHLPVYLDLRLPAQAGVSTNLIDFGVVRVNSSQSRTFQVSNTANTALWGTNGLQRLNYTMTSTSGATVPSSSFFVNPGASANTHAVVLNTSTLGVRTGTITITTDAADNPVRTITWRADIRVKAPEVGGPASPRGNPTLVGRQGFGL